MTSGKKPDNLPDKIQRCPVVPSLNDTRIRAAKPADKPYTLQDGSGLYLEVRPSGAKVWRYRFWLTSEKDGRYTIGEYPSVSLSDARRERERAREMVKQGVNPTFEKQTDKLRQATVRAETFEAVAREWIGKMKARWTPYYLTQVERGMAGDIFPCIGRLPMKTITAAHVLEILRRAERRGAEAVAINLRQWCSAVFRYAVATLRADFDPAAALRGAVMRPQIEHAKPMTRDQIGDFLIRLGEFGGNRTTAIALRLVLLCFVRTVEIRKAEWSEIDVERAEWKIPAEKMKMRRPHIVPLPRQAVTALKELKGITGAGRWLFPNNRRPADVMSATTLNRALEYMGYDTGTVTAHDFRATASTRLHEMGFRPDVIERQLAHVERNKTKAAYNHAEYLSERREMMQAWANWIDQIETEVRAAGGIAPRR